MKFGVTYGSLIVGIYLGSLGLFGYGAFYTAHPSQHGSGRFLHGRELSRAELDESIDEVRALFERGSPGMTSFDNRFEPRTEFARGFAETYKRVADENAQYEAGYAKFKASHLLDDEFLLTPAGRRQGIASIDALEKLDREHFDRMDAMLSDTYDEIGQLAGKDLRSRRDESIQQNEDLCAAQKHYYEAVRSVLNFVSTLEKERAAGKSETRDANSTALARKLDKDVADAAARLQETSIRIETERKNAFDEALSTLKKPDPGGSGSDAD